MIRNLLLAWSFGLFLASGAWAAGRVKVTYQDEEEARAMALAQEIAPGLARLEDQFLARWRAAGTDPAVRSALLRGAREDIERVLSAPELAAARDYLLDGLDDGLPPSGTGQGAGGIRLAANLDRSADAETTLGDLGEQLAARMRQVSQRAERGDLLAELCIVTRPGSGARFRLWPQSYPDGARDTVSVGTVRVYRGLHAYSVAPAGGGAPFGCDRKTEPTCPRLDLMTDSRPALHCDLKARACARRLETPKRCRE